MAVLHAAGALVVFAVTALAMLAAAVAGVRGGARWVDALRVGVTALVVIQAAIGALTYLTGARPGEPLHLLYGVAATAVLPLAASFATEAPPRPRAWVLAIALGILLILLWRLATTG
jgi:heme A synthase